MFEKITVKNFTTLTDWSALIRAGLYLSGETALAEENGICYQKTITKRGGVGVKITEKEPSGTEIPESLSK